MKSLPLLIATTALLSAQTPAVPDWAQPGSATHKQVAPPSDFHRPTKNFAIPIGIFDGQSDIGSAVVPGSASYDAASKRYTINSAGYNAVSYTHLDVYKRQQHDRRAGHQQNVGRISARRLLQDVIERSGTLRRARCAGRRFLAGRGAVQLRDYFGKFTIVFAHAVNSILARGELRSPDKLKHVPHICLLYTSRCV